VSVGRDAVELFIGSLGQEPSPLYVIAGDLVLAEAAAQRLAAALAEGSGGDRQLRRRPGDILALVQDLRTFSLFGTAKVVVAVDTAVLGDRKVAAELVSEASAAPPPSPGEALGEAQREAASRLLQALHLFGIDPRKGNAAQTLEQLPDWALLGPRGRSKKQAEERRERLAALLESGLGEGLEGVGQGGVALLGEILRRGLPRGHCLILAERSVAAGHPIVEQLQKRRAFLEVGRVALERGGDWGGTSALARELESELGASLLPDALQELARRTLRQEERRGSSEASSESTARFAGELRKLAQLAAGAPITRALVEQAVEDRGEEDVWQILDAVAGGRAGEALERLERLLGGSEDAVATRLSFFALLAAFCRQLVAVHGMVGRLGLPRGERSYARFRDRLAPALTAELPEGWPSPLSGLHPYRLHRVYLAASRASGPALAHLPWRILETELALKGESGQPGAALSALVAELAGALRA
jgi:DNA polymerase III delta subunit